MLKEDNASVWLIGASVLVALARHSEYLVIIKINITDIRLDVAELHAVIGNTDPQLLEMFKEDDLGV